MPGSPASKASRMSYGASRYQFRTDAGEYNLYLPMPRILVGRVVGHGTEEIARAMIVGMDANMRDLGSVTLFTDLSRMTDYESGARQVLTDWQRKNDPKIEATHILVRSKLVAMGVTVANLALRGSMRVHTDEHEFEDALHEEIARLRDLAN